MGTPIHNRVQGQPTQGLSTQAPSTNSHLTQSVVACSLGYLGLIPFFASLYWMLLEQAPLNHDPKFVFTSYSAIILSFLGGTLWGRSIQLKETTKGSILLVASNVAAIAAWASLLLGIDYLVFTLSCLVFGFSALILIEYLGHNSFLDDVEPYYLKLRFVLTGLVLLAHFIFLIKLF